jgi:membrane-associated phospholipid phosphatase
MNLPIVTRANLATCLAAGYAAFCVLYLGSAAAAIGTPYLLEPTALDRAVPFVAQSIWIYLSQFVLLPYALATASDDAARTRGFYAMLVATVIAAAIFVLLPTRVTPGAAPSDGLIGLAWHGLRLADTAHNAFPSLHVALSAIAGILLWRTRRMIAVAWPALVVVSTLTTRQHVAWDVAGGFVLAAIAWVLVPKLIRHERPNASPHPASR